MKTILISGVGNLGSRYLQGLATYHEELNITVHDVSTDSINNARERWEEVAGGTNRHNVSYLFSLDKIPEEIDLVILSTNADVRAKAIRSIADRGKVRYWVLEKVLAQCLFDLNEIETITNLSNGVWVNLPRRMMFWHRKIGMSLFSDKPVKVYVGKGNVGLACNSVHYLDLASWWTNEKLVSLDTSELSSSWTKSKRQGFYEVSGTLKAVFSGGSELLLVSHSDSDNENQIRIKTADCEWCIDEIKGVAQCSDGMMISGKLENQSDMTGRLVESIFISEQCALPTLDESIQIHHLFLASMLDHWNKSNGLHDTKVPIT